MNAETKELSAKTRYQKIDHIAIAVRDLDAAIEFFQENLGFNLMQRRVVHGARTGMISAEMEHNDIKFVLCQGTEPESQVSRLIENYGVGVAHIALAVDDADTAARELGQQGLKFDTTVIRGAGLKQVFSTRDPNSGLSFEFIERDASEHGFREENINELFAQLEKSGAY
jgi:4-hydroxyphenylpyruvate dioxygenase-like putative hemolysin